jgi:hypothetical protein
LLDHFGDPAQRVIAPGSTAHSMMLTRIATLGDRRMPPLGRSTPDTAAIQLFTDWITQDLGPRVAGRWVFYNRSKFDNNGAGAEAADDQAIATDKAALLPGHLATFANYTSYSRGLNGLMVDLQNLPAGSVLSASDFTFRVGNSGNPGAWATAPAPLSISLRRGAGVGGSDRVTLLWADNAIQKQWLQVTVQATAQTGLATADVFYFGNAIGESGNSASDALVGPADELGARSNPRSGFNPAPITFRYDYNRDGIVDAQDQLLSRTHVTSGFTALQLISVP